MLNEVEEDLALKKMIKEVRADPNSHPTYTLEHDPSPLQGSISVIYPVGLDSTLVGRVSCHPYRGTFRGVQNLQKSSVVTVLDWHEEISD